MIKYVLAIGFIIFTAGNSFAGELQTGDKGITYKSDDGNIGLRFGGRLHLDTVSFDDDITNLKDDTDFRRLRFYLSGKLYEDWSFKIERDVAGTNDDWKNVYVRYNGLKNISIKAGNQIPPFGLEDVDSSNSIKLIERSIANILTPPGFFLGGQVKYAANNWTVAAGAFIDPITDRGEPSSNEGEGNVAARITYAPIKSKQQTLHIGASVAHRKIDDDKSFSISPRPEVGITNTRLIRTGGLGGVDDTTAYDIEAAWAQGAFLLQGEYIHRSVERRSRSDFDFDGWYVQGAWVLTGERQKYSKNSGKFRGIRPKDSKFGAVELAARFSTLDLDDGNLSRAGEQDNASIGVNWYLNRNVRLMANYIWMDVDANAAGSYEEPEAFLARLQIAF